MKRRKTIGGKSRRCRFQHLSMQKYYSRSNIKVYHTYRVIYPIFLPKMTFFQMQGEKIHHKKRSWKNEYVRIRCRLSKNQVLVGVNRDSPLLQIS